MDEIRRLEREIRRLQRELESQNAKTVRMRQELADENLIKLNRYREEMKDQLKKHDKQVEKEYQRLLKEYQKSADKEIQEKRLEMDQEYQKLLAETREKEKEWRNKTEELNKLITDLKTKAKQKEQSSIEEAKNYTAQAVVAFKEVEKKPHEKFCPKRAGVFQGSIAEAIELIKGGMTEAAIAVAISTRSGLNRLGFEIDERTAQWQHLYNVFRRKVEFLDEQRKEEVNVWRKHSLQEQEAMGASEKKIINNEIDFWSKGEWSSFGRELSEFGSEIVRVESLGMEEYLMLSDGLSEEQLEKNIHRLDELEKQFEQMSAVYKVRYDMSGERADWGEKIIDYFEDELNLLWIEEKTHYRPTEEITPEYDVYMKAHYGEEYQREDLREWLELTFENAVESRIYIYIIPYEKGVHVENRLVVYVDFQGAENLEYSRQIHEHVKESIGLEEEDGTIQFATELTQLTLSMNETLRETGKALEQKIRERR